MGDDHQQNKTVNLLGFMGQILIVLSGISTVRVGSTTGFESPIMRSEDANPFADARQTKALFLRL